jgi:hypothetical protein
MVLRTFKRDAGIDRQHETIREQRGVQRGEGLRAQCVRVVEGRLRQVGPMLDGVGGRSKPDAVGQVADRAQFRPHPSVQHDDAMCRARQAMRGQKVRVDAGVGGRRRLRARGGQRPQIGEAPRLVVAAWHADFDEARHGGGAPAGEPRRLAGHFGAHVEHAAQGGDHRVH